MVSTADSRFHVLYDVNGVHVDVYELRWCETRHVLTHLFTLLRDTYHTKEFVVVFREVDGEWRLIFNRRYEGLAVYALPQGTELFRDMKPFEFLGKPVPIPVAEPLGDAYTNRFWWCWSWIWGGPHVNACILDMKAVAEAGATCLWQMRLASAADDKMLTDKVLCNDRWACYSGDWQPVTIVGVTESEKPHGKGILDVQLVDVSSWDVDGAGEEAECYSEERTGFETYGCS
jgi:hypothetical protein